MQPLDPLTLPLRGRMLIEASAGTGKTYTLALLFVRLLLELELGVDRILVVTFTTAATEELRGRIRSRIREALDVLEGVRPDDETLQQLLAGARIKKNPAKAAILLKDALTRMDEAAIFTIHGFCGRMLKEHAFESGAPFSMEFLENEHALRTEIMADFWRDRFYTASREEAAWAASLWKEPQELYENLGGHLSRPGVRCLPIIEDDDLVQIRDRLRPLFADIRTLWRQQGEEITALLQDNKRLSRNNRAGYGHKRLAVALTAMADFTRSESMPWLLPKEVSLFSTSAINGSLLQNNHPPPEHRFFDLVEHFITLHNEMTRCQKISILLAAREYLHKELGRRKQEQARLYFDDLLLQMDAALQGPRSEKFAADISARFPAILVDEFQDTDPMQYHIFSRIHQAGQNSSLFLIGDPKQAIYGFRGADIFTYLAARQQTPPENRYTMTTNYRSTGPMVEMVNRLFDRENPFLLAADAMKFTRVRAAGNTDDRSVYVGDTPVAPLTCLLLPESGKGKPMAKKEAAKLAARFCAHEIASLLARGRMGTGPDAGPVTGGDIGILVRTHREAEIMRNALTACTIASVYSGRSSVLQSPEADQILTLLCALLQPEDQDLVRTLLTTDLFGYDALQIEHLRHKEQELDEITAALRRYRQILRQQGFLPMFYTLLADRRNVGRLLALPNGERVLTNFLHLAELLQEAARNRPGIEGLQRRLADWILRPEEQEEDSSQLRLESDENLVKIVTIHKSKGLEYPVVFLPFLWATRPCSQTKPFSFHQPDQPEQLCIDLGSGNDEYFQLAEQERLAADLRLLYVAVTRARSNCFFCWGTIKKMDETALCHLLHGGQIPDRETLLADLARLSGQQNGLVVKQIPEEAAPAMADARSSTTPLAPARFTGSIDTTRGITSYSGLIAGSDSRPERPDHDDRGGPLPRPAGFTVFGFPRGPAAGTCLHTIFEQISFTDPTGHQAVVADQLARAGFESQWQQVVTTWVRDVLATKLTNGCFLNLITNDQRINEMAFTFPLEKMRLARFNEALSAFDIAPLPEQHSELQGLMVGFIDLIFRWKGRYYIVDYKSNYLGDSPEQYGAEQLAAAMLEHRYDLQYLIYTLALHRFLSSRMADYDYERLFGGACYLFLRGMNPHYPAGSGVFAARPPLELIRRLDGCCRGEEVADA